jgi:spore coat polysaccharide biosynthesis protein SpsF
MEGMKIVCIVQARMGSSRLPGKVLMDLAGRPMIERVIARLHRSRTLSEVVVATTIEAADDVIWEKSIKQSWSCFRGSETDLLDRYYKAAFKYDADIVVRITSDCPMIDPLVVDRVVTFFLAHYPELDYASNTIQPRTFPLGLDTEVMSFQALERAWREDRNPEWREHSTPYIYKTPGAFRIKAFNDSVDRSFMRWTVDTAEDLAFVQKIFEHFKHDEFSWTDVVSLLEIHPEWMEINRHVVQKRV